MISFEELDEGKVRILTISRLTHLMKTCGEVLTEEKSKK